MLTISYAVQITSTASHDAHAKSPSPLQIIIGCMLLCTVQALGELAVLYPIEGAFFNYSVRFLDRSWGFAMGYQYALGWLITLPFEITAAGLTIDYWHKYNIGIWIGVFLTLLAIVQVFGVKGYGEGKTAQMDLWPTI